MRPRLEWLESRVLPALDLLSTTGAFQPSQFVPAPPPLAQPQAEVQATLPDAQPSLWYRLEVNAPAVLRANLSSLEGVGLRLALTGSTGSLLVTSEGLTGDLTGAAIVQHVEAGTYYVSVSADEAARFHLVTHLSSATSPTHSLPTGAHPRAVREVDLNGDGRLDLLTANEAARSLSVLLGNGDGTFQPRREVSLTASPRALLVQDLDGDFRPDVLAATPTGLLLLTGDGAGGFASNRLLPFPGVPGEMALGDLTGDGLPDLVVTDVGTQTLAGSTVAVLEGDGHGGFVPLRTLPVGRLPAGLALADVTGDGRLDILCTTQSFAQLRIFPGDGHGGFGARRSVPVGNAPSAVVTLDLDGNGSIDLVSADAGDDTLTVLFAEGSSFRPLKIPTGADPSALAAGDLNADGRPDLVTACAGESLQVFLSIPGGGFALRGAYPVGSAPAEVRLADLQGDGILDLVCVNAAGDELFVLLGNGDGTFLSAPKFLVGPDPFSVALADINLDGQLDVLTADGRDSQVSVRLGNGDGTFLARASQPTGERPVAVVASDLNNDGRPDLVTANRSAGTLSVLLGLGDGTFLPSNDYQVGLDPQAVLVADVTADGLLDLVSANSRSGSITIWQGLGNGLFRDALQVPVAAGPFALAVADINRDGLLDLACAGEADGMVTLLLQGERGRAFTRRDLAVGPNPVSVALADLDRDGWLDLLSSRRGGGITLLRGVPSGTFVREADLPTSSTVFALAAADVDADGWIDLLSAEYGAGTLALRRGLGDARFSAPEDVPLGEGPIALDMGDLNRDGRLDLVTANSLDASVTVLLGTEAGFVPRSPGDEVPFRHTPHLVDLDGDGTQDSVVLDRFGQLFFRPGLPGQQTFGTARVLNRDHPARDVTPVFTGAGWALAAIDLDPIGSGPTVYPVSLYRLGPTGVLRSVALTLSIPASRILAGQLDGSGRDALVLAHGLDGQVSIALPGSRPGEFAAPMTRKTGSVPSDLSLADLRSDGRAEVLLPDAGGSGLTVVRNDPGLALGGLARFRATPGLSGLDAAGAVASLYQASSIVVGDFLPGGGPDAAVFLQGSNEIVVLENNGRGGFLNPDPSRISPADTGRQAGQAAGPLVAADVNGDGLLDLALLRRDLGEVWIFLAQGAGRFVRHSVVAVGHEAGGITPWPSGATGHIDLLVGNSFGDLLRLVGLGDGTFVLPGPQRGNRVTLAVLDGSSVLVANQQRDRLTVQQPAAGGNTYTPTNTLPGSPPGQLIGLVDPLPLRLEGPTDRFVDVVVVGTASNSVLVYRGLGRGAYASPITYPVGTQPVDVTAADLNHDGVLDLVVTNRGSNDLSLLFGQLDAQGRWVAQMGPRLRSGGVAPLGTSVRTLSDGQQQLIVTNSFTTTDSRLGNVTILAGRGLGFFDDRDPLSVAIPPPTNHPDPDPPTKKNSPPVIWVPGANGNVLGVDLNAMRSLGVVYDAGGVGVRNLVPLSGGRAVITLEDGRVSLLRSLGDDTLTLQANLTALEGIPSEPDALQILETGGTLRALVTSLGSDQVYVFDLLTGRPVDLPSIDRSRDLTPTAVSLPGSSLAVVVILLAGELTEALEPGAERTALAELQTAPSDGTRPSAGTDEEPTPSSGGGDDEESDPAPDQVADIQETVPSAIDAEDELRNRPLPEPTEPAPAGIGSVAEPAHDMVQIDLPHDVNPEEGASCQHSDVDPESDPIQPISDPFTQKSVHLREVLTLVLLLHGSARIEGRRPGKTQPTRLTRSNRAR
ncbi:MAG: VCBS repeat-containing protein [Gemmataceae bacterium]